MTDLGGFSMFELFKEEVETHCAALSEGLLAIESNPDDLVRIEPLMRAAHSVKGAARIIGLDLVVRLAHAMEDCLVNAQQGRERLSPGRVDQLLRGVDLLAQAGAMDEADIAGWTDRSTAAVEPLVAEIEAPAPPEAEAAPAHEAAVITPTREAEPADSAFVRVGADRLNRLLQLVGESMVESRRMQSFKKSLHEMKQLQRRLEAAVEDAKRRRRAGDPASLDEIRRLGDTAHEGIRVHADELEETLRRYEELSTALYNEVLGSRMRPFSEGTAALPRLVRDLARSLGKKVKLEVRGGAVGVDRDVLAKLEAPMNHMLRNCIDHGIEMPDERRAAGKPESGTVTIEARHHAGMLVVQLGDDGRGIDVESVRRRVAERGLAEASLVAELDHDEVLEFLFLPGFSTAGKVTEISGRGVGLDVVQTMVQEVSGTVRIETEAGRGTAFTMRLPVTLSVLRAAIVDVSGEPYAFALTHLGRICVVESDSVTPVEGRQQFMLDGRSVGLVSAAEILGLGMAPPSAEAISVIVLGEDERQCGLVVDRFLGEQDLVVRRVDARLGKVPHLAAAAVLENGQPVLIVDAEDLLQSMRQLLQEGRLRGVTAMKTDAAVDAPPRILVVDDSITVREVERQLLTRRGYAVDVAVDGQDGWNAIQSRSYALLITDVDMPRMSGFELIEMVRHDDRMAGLPIIIVSYKDREEDRMRGMELGANAYLTKGSFHDDSLVNMVADLLGRERA